MTKEELLSQLKSIQIPHTVVHWWQMAVGWYILIAVFILVCIIIFIIFKQQQKKRHALRVLTNAAERIFKENPDNCHTYAYQISYFLKQVVIKYSKEYHNRVLAGDDWSSYLNQIYASANFDVLIESAYNPNKKFDINNMHQDVILLLKKISKKKCLK